MVYAHSRNAAGQRHALVDHLQVVASLAADFGRPFGAEQIGYWAGLWHDLGKFHPDFQSYLLACEREPNRAHKSPGHSAAGACFALDHLEPAALLIHGHHAGLQTPSGISGVLNDAGTKAVAEEALSQARRAITKIEPSDRISFPDCAARDRRSAEMLLRLVFSALIDADRLDTERHFRPDVTAERTVSADLSVLWDRFQRYHRRRFEGTRQDSVADMRQTVYEACLAAAERRPGIFRLAVPTGGGKTLSAMAFALRHALRHGQERVIVAVPFISITEQTADEYRKALEPAQEAGRVVLEHHSAADRLERDDEDYRTAAVWARLAAENWDAPVVVTTTVQLFESLFANRPSRCRKLHRLARSVIILDEAQALPPHLLRPVLDGLQELAAHYGTSVVISTATQPAFEAVPDFASVRALDMVPDPAGLFAGLRRVDYEWHIDPPLSWGEVAGLVADQRQALLVVNTKGDALAALDALDDPAALHLSTLLCSAHRRRVIDEIKRRLLAGEPCRVVSTQVIEAGVDLDFPAVLRAMGPLDSIIQAAGRCNREGHLPQGHVLVFRPAEGGLPTGSYRTATDITGTLLGRGGLDPNDPAMAREYFRLLFQTVDTDSKQIQDRREHFDYPEVARRFRMIDDDTIGLVVTPYLTRCGSEAERRRVRELVEQLRQGHPEARLLRRRLEPYVVSVFARKAEEFERKGLLAPIIPGLYEWLGDYDRVLGITERDLDADSLVV